VLVDVDVLLLVLVDVLLVVLLLVVLLVLLEVLVVDELDGGLELDGGEYVEVLVEVVAEVEVEVDVCGCVARLMNCWIWL
jgi:hypothetical protein